MMIMPTANGFIGVTTRGGIPQRVAGRETVPGCGTVFQLTGPIGEGQPWTESILYTFQEGTDCFPETIMAGPNGTLIGTTFGIPNRGTVFQLTPPAPGSPVGTPWTEAYIHKFVGADGSNPIGNLTLTANGTVLGVTQEGGSFGYGEVYELTPPSAAGQPWTRKVIQAFDTTNGAYPSSGLIAGPAGSYFGTTQGTYDSTQNDFVNGSVYQLVRAPGTPSGWTVNVVYLFTDPAIGSVPAGLIYMGDQTLLGYTSSGGANQQGTIFNLSF